MPPPGTITTHYATIVVIVPHFHEVHLEAALTAAWILGGAHKAKTISPRSIHAGSQRIYAKEKTTDHVQPQGNGQTRGETITTWPTIYVGRICCYINWLQNRNRRLTP
jgi:hypothetical protein